ncbi:hypothetical protein SKAU_G00150850 [Synaphobranchus kaupii]|uniref:Solute carrier family 43 member 3 n=1 Tax=Synaphobranchus kaupii TaxID=118154 RepID=A0A9Q1IYS8_SYNKA|nr:hypothetical protein SKAU_G00150850 [Synaphobranchus kaupii]
MCHLSGLRVRCWLTLVTGLVECLLFSGVIFGWASLVFILKDTGYFSDQCVNVTGPNDTHYTDCSEQDKHFSLVFTIASFLQNLISLLNGIFFDHFGTMASRLLAMERKFVQGIMKLGSWDIGIVTIECSMVTTFCIESREKLHQSQGTLMGNLFDKHRSSIITLYNGAFNSSAITFLIVKIASERGISLHHAFFFLSACSVIHFIRTFVLMPPKHIPYPLPEGYTYETGCGQTKCNTCCLSKRTGNNTELVQRRERMENATSQPESPQQAPPTDKSFKQCVFSWIFLWHLVWMSVVLLRNHLFISTVNPMLAYLAEGDLDIVSHYTNTFAYTQLCGILCAPWNGLIIDSYKAKKWAPALAPATGETEEESNLRSVVLSLFLTALQCISFAVCITIPVLPLQYLSFVLQVLNDAFLTGGSPAFISIIFPARHFGKLFGLARTLSTLALALQFPCIILVNEVLDGDPLYINIAMCILCLATFIHPAYIFIRWRRLANQRRHSAQPPANQENSISDNGDTRNASEAA